MRLLATALCLGLLCLDVGASWGTSQGCQLTPIAAPMPVSYEWKQNQGRADQVDLYRNGQSVGSFFTTEGKYYTYHRGTWGQAVQPPVNVPAWANRQAEDEGRYFFGLVPEGLSQEEKFTRKGKEITHGEAVKALKETSAGQLEDDSKHPHITGIGKDTQAAGELRKILEGAAGKKACPGCRIQVYDLSRNVDKVMMEPFQLDKDEEFQRAGSVVLFQGPGSEGRAKVLYSVYGSPGTEEMSEGLRRIDPNFNPNKTPRKGDGKKKDGANVEPSQAASCNLGPFLVLGTAGALGAALRRKE